MPITSTAYTHTHTLSCYCCSQVEMNSTHKPGRQDETDRIQRAGGWITEEKYVIAVCCYMCVSMYTILPA